MNNETFEMVAKTQYGLEEILAGELIALGANSVEIGRRMVAFEGDKELMYKANFHCRTALRILKPIYRFKAKNADEVYNQVKSIDWEKYMKLTNTFAIDSVIYSEDFNHTKFVAYRTKDAIADHFNEKYGKRPSVRVSNPDLYINIHISHNDCTVSIDSSGESLHKRGYRVDQTEAPLNEVLAAGMIMKTGWKGESNFVDPMCGSGTLLIEAAMIALNIAPGMHRKEFAFEKWNDFDQELFDRIYNDDSQEKEFQFKIYGSDVSPVAIEIARKNIRSAGLNKYIDLQVLPLQQYQNPPLPGIMVTNPPYGERISSRDLLGLYEMIGERMKHAFMGYNAWIISYQEECFEKIGLRPTEKHKLINGSLECEYRRYEIFAGKRDEYKKAQSERGDAPQERTERKPYNKERGDRKPYDRSGSERKPYNRDRPERSDSDRTERRPYSSDRTERKPYSREDNSRPRSERDDSRRPSDTRTPRADTPARRFMAAHNQEPDSTPTNNTEKTFIDLSARKTFNIERSERTSRPRVGDNTKNNTENENND